MVRKLPKPTIGEISNSELEDHLVTELGLSVFDCPTDDVELADTNDLYNKFKPPPDETPWTFDSGDLETPPVQWYDVPDYDCVFSTKLQDESAAKARLLRMQLKNKARPVGKVFYSCGRFCQRVKYERPR